MRAQNAENADARPQALHLQVRRIGRVLQPVNHDPAGFGLKIDKSPVEGANLHAAAGGSFQLGHDPSANQVLKPTRIDP